MLGVSALLRVFINKWVMILLFRAHCRVWVADGHKYCCVLCDTVVSVIIDCRDTS
jgi:hypothetical protein